MAHSLQLSGKTQVLHSGTAIGHSMRAQHSGVALRYSTEAQHPGTAVGHSSWAQHSGYNTRLQHYSARVDVVALLRVVQLMGRLCEVA